MFKRIKDIFVGIIGTILFLITGAFGLMASLGTIFILWFLIPLGIRSCCRNMDYDRDAANYATSYYKITYVDNKIDTVSVTSIHSNYERVDEYHWFGDICKNVINARLIKTVKATPKDADDLNTPKYTNITNRHSRFDETVLDGPDDDDEAPDLTWTMWFL